jgi:hypothetical protein
MKCATHNSDATAVCPYCGKALCPSCSRSGGGVRTACSDACATALAKADKAAELVIRKSKQLARASALCCYLLGALFVICGVWVPFIPVFRGDLFPPLFFGGTGLALVVCGVWYDKAAKQNDS